jgi:gluconokinase
LWCYRLDRRRILIGGALSDGGGLHAWMRERLKLGEDAKAVEAALGVMEPDAHGLTILPFWAGERSTGWHTAAHGAILGLTMHTVALDITRAAMEAISYRLALLASALSGVASFKTIIASGGALDASPSWTQIIADVLNHSVALSRIQEASSRGAVLLALEATGAIASIDEAQAPPLRTFEPDAGRHARYCAALARQQEYYELLIKE